MHVRLAQPSDARAIAEIRVRTWQYAYRGLMPGDFLARLKVDDKLPMWEKIFSAPREELPVFVAVESEGETGRESVIGFCSAGKSRDEGASGETGEIYAIYVAPEHMGRGAGAALINRACEALAQAGCTEATLWVLEANARARVFYERVGWAFDGARKVEPGDGFDFTEVRYRTQLDTQRRG